MNSNYTQEVKQAALSRHILDGESIQQIATDTGIAKSTLYCWLDQLSKEQYKPQPRESYLLEKRVKKFTKITQILQNVDCTVQSPLREKLEAMEKLHGKYSVHSLCDALEVPRGTFYNHLFRSKKENTWFAKRRIKLKNRVQELFYEYRQVLGAGKIAALLKDQGVKISEKYVAELMHELGLHSVRIGAKAIYEREQRKIVNRINQQFTASKPNELWLSDVTYFRFGEETFYICAVLDVYARKIVAYRVSQNNSTQLTKSTLKEAYLTRHPDSGLILHTDRGSNYVSKTFCKAMSSMNITQSYSRTRKPHDNAMMESFFSTLKKEELYRTNYRSVRDFKESLAKYIDMYNNSRPHSALGNKAPNTIENAYYSAKVSA